MLATQDPVENLLADVAVDTLSREQRASLLLPILQRIQRELGYIPATAFPVVAEIAGVPESRVYGVATFFAQFKFAPTGRNVITLCRGTACHVRGSRGILADVCKRLGIEPGGTTPDRHFSLQTVACFGSCALAPVAVINGRVYGRMTRARLMRAIDTLAEEARAIPQPEEEAVR